MSNDDTDFNALLADVIENPEFLETEKGRSLTYEQLLKLTEAVNPYGPVAAPAPGGKKEALIFSWTNVREIHQRRLVMTSLIGFIFRMLKEWEVPEAARTWVEEEAEEEAEAVSAGTLAARIEALAALAKEAAAAEKRAGELQQAAREVVAEGLAGKGKGKGKNRAPEDAALQAADQALAQARGLQFAALHESRKLGKLASGGLPAQAKLAAQHPDVARELERDPAYRAMFAARGARTRQAPAAPAKAIIDHFLRSWLEYNPDAHVRKAFDEFVTEGLEGGVDPGDPERLPLALVGRAEHLPVGEVDEAHRGLYRLLRKSSRASAAASWLLAPENETARTAVAAVLTHPEASQFRRYLAGVPEGDEARAAAVVIPPQDTFHRWEYYENVNYEALRQAAEAIYHEKSDLETALLPLKRITGASEAELEAAYTKYIDVHQDELKTVACSANFGCWTLLGSFDANRKRGEFLNRHTSVLARIFKRVEEDKKIGQELMRNRVRTEKARNIQTAGPDAPGLAEYRAGGGDGYGAGGAAPALSTEERLRLERAGGDLAAARELEHIDELRERIDTLTKASRTRDLSPEEAKNLREAEADLPRAEEMLHVPDNAIQVDVWETDGERLSKKHFYTKSVDPPTREEVDQAHRGAASSSSLAPFAQKSLEASLDAERAANAARIEAEKLRLAAQEE